MDLASYAGIEDVGIGKAESSSATVVAHTRAHTAVIAFCLYVGVDFKRHSVNCRGRIDVACRVLLLARLA